MARRLSIPLFLFSFAWAQAGQSANIAIDLEAPGAEIPSLIYGNNFKAWGSGAGELVWDVSNRRLKEGITQRLAPLGSTLLRFPGGSKAEEYDWKAAVGPRRGGVGTRFDFGTDEFLELCRLLHAVPILTVNGGGDPRLAADWVEYCNGAATTPMGRLRAENGHPQPYGIVHWEIGNENYVSVRARDYAESFPRFAAAMKAVDPKIRLGAVGWGWTNWKSHYTKDAEAWNETVLAVAGRHIDAFIIHEYCWIDPKPAVEARTPGLAHTVLGWPRQMAEELSGVRASFARAGVPDLPIWMTEFNGYYGEGGMCRPLGHTVNGILIASMLHEFIRLRIPLVCYWDLATSGWGRFAAVANPSEGKWLYRPSWYVLSLYARAFSGKELPVTVAGPSFDHSKYSIVRAATNTPGVDAVACVDQGRVALMVVNKMPEPVQLHLSFKGKMGATEIVHTLFSGEELWGERCGIRTVTNRAASPLVVPPWSVSAFIYPRALPY